MVNSDYQKFVYWMNVKVHIKVMPVKDLLIFFFKMNDVLACNPISFNLDFLNQLMCTLFAWTADVMKYLSICEIDGNYTDVFFRPNLKITTLLFK